MSKLQSPPPILGQVVFIGPTGNENYEVRDCTFFGDEPLENNWRFECQSCGEWIEISVNWKPGKIIHVCPKFGLPIDVTKFLYTKDIE